MTPQMIRVLVYFMLAMILKESFELADMENAKDIATYALLIVSLIFVGLVCRQW